jgi:hypothetical protein
MWDALFLVQHLSLPRRWRGFGVPQRALKGRAAR